MPPGSFAPTGPVQPPLKRVLGPADAAGAAHAEARQAELVQRVIVPSSSAGPHGLVSKKIWPAPYGFSGPRV